MKFQVIVGCMIVLAFCGAERVRFASQSARQAQKDHVANLQKAHDGYVSALKKAQDLAFESRDREEVNRIETEIERLRAKVPSDVAEAPFAGKSFRSAKFGPVLFREDGAYISSDQLDGAKWFRVDDLQALVWTHDRWVTLFVFSADYSSVHAYNVGQVDRQSGWTAPAIKPN